MRINAYLARAGVASRRAADRLVQEGRVTVDGEPATLGTSVGAGDRVEVDGHPVAPERFAYVLLHKPAGVVTTARDPQGRPTVVGLVPRAERLFPVGRLDADTTGVLLLTNDGPLAHRLAHPRYGVEKAYEAEVEGSPGRVALARLAGGIDLDGRATAPAVVRVVARGRGRTTLELVLHEGRKHQVKRMCEAVGHPVVRLQRTRYAGIGLDGLAPGEWRELTAREVAGLRRRTARGASPRPATRARGSSRRGG
jgi:pseudouridine synthase